MDKEIIRTVYDRYNAIESNCIELVERLNNQNDSFYKIKDESEITEILRDPAAYVNNLINNDEQVKEILNTRFGTDDITSLTPEERVSGLFERSLKTYVDYYSTNINELTRGRDELALNVSTNQKAHELWRESVKFVSFGTDKSKWRYDKGAVLDDCTVYAYDPAEIKAIRKCKELYKYINSEECPQWFKKEFSDISSIVKKQPFGLEISQYYL